MKKNEVGRIGEAIAGKYIEGKGWKILFKNYRQKFGEIDIIAKNKNSEVIFIEVKTLSRDLMKSQNSFLPEDNFTTQKRNIVNRMCQFFVARYPQVVNEDAGWRIDLIAIEIFEGESAPLIRHYENI